MPTILANMFHDIRYALRQLRRSPGFAATAILTLALGIGATTAIFTLVYQVLLRSIPVAHPEQLYKVGKENCGSCVNSGLQDDWDLFSTDLYRALRDGTPGTAGIAAVQSATTTVSARRTAEAGAGSSAEAVPLDVHFVSGNYFSVLGVEPYAGRMLTPEDDREGAAPATVLSYRLWQTKFAGDPRLVGSTLLLSGHPVTVVGISARAFLGERNRPDAPGLWLPMAEEPVFDTDRPLSRFPASHWLNVILRIPDAREVPHVQLALQGALRQWLTANSGLFPRSTPAMFARQHTELVAASTGINDLRDRYEQNLHLLLLVAGFVLLIACANLANLMLVRGMARKQELAVRSALGAPRLRLVRQMMTEAVLLSLVGGAAAIAVAYAGTRGILALAMRGAESSPLSAAPSLPVLGFALAVSLVTGVVFGIVPAWITSRTSPVEALRGANRSTRDSSALPQKILVILQATLSLVLLSTAGLLITSLRQLEHQNFGFQPGGRLLVFTDLQAAGYSYDRLAGLYRRFDDTFARVSSIETFGYGTYTPMTGDNWAGGVSFPGVTATPGSQSNALYSSVSAHYFPALGIAMRQGRALDEHDTATSAHVAVVNETFARRFFAGKNPIGQRFGPDPERPAEFEIVGVAVDAKNANPSEPVRPTYYTPITQSIAYTAKDAIAIGNSQHYASNFVFRYRGDPTAAAAAVRQALREIDPEIPVIKLLTYEDQLSTNFTEEELVVRLTTLFGLLALVLASIGLYGVTAYAVARRTSEIGIRMALGASRGQVLAMVVRGALTQAALGLLLGLPLCFAAAQLLRHTLYQTSAFQPGVLLAVAGLLLLSAFIAAAIPARRAASIDPLHALRTE